MSHFNIEILDKPEFFAEKLLFQKDEKNLKLYLPFEK